MKTMIRRVPVTLMLFLFSLVFAFGNENQSPPAYESIQYDPQLKIILGGGGNSVILTSEDKSQALVVDTKMGQASNSLKASVMTKNITIINTHYHPDHVGGNSLFPDAHVISGAYTKEEWLSGTKFTRYPDEVIKIGEEKIIQIGSEKVHVRNMGRAHTFDDVILYLEKRKMLITGDLVFIKIHPVLLDKSGANVESWLKALDFLYNNFDIKSLVPGHGPVSDKSALKDLKEYFVSIAQSTGTPVKLAELKEKYKDYYPHPGMADFDRTVAFIEKEQKTK